MEGERKMEQRTRYRQYGRAGLLVVALAVAAVIATGLTGSQVAEAQGGTTVNVALAEWTIVPEPGVVETGEITFAVSNVGDRQHELVVLQSAFAPDALPVDGDEEFVLEDQVNVIARTDRIISGATASLTLSLSPGFYMLICNLESHYANGQRISFLVTAVGVAPESLPNTGSGGLGDPSNGGGAPLILASIAAAGIVALSIVGRVVRPA